jgi:hypothetical protein
MKLYSKFIFVGSFLLLAGMLTACGNSGTVIASGSKVTAPLYVPTATDAHQVEDYYPLPAAPKQVQRASSNGETLMLPPGSDVAAKSTKTKKTVKN